MFIIFAVDISNIKAYVESLALFDVFILDLLAHETDLGGLSIVHVAVSEHQLHILDELPHAPVVVLLQIFLNRPKVHRLFYDVIIVVYLKFFRVHGLIEDPCFGVLTQCIHHPGADLLPVVINGDTLIDWRHLYVLHLVFILEQLGYLRMIFGHLLKFLLGNWAVLRPIKNLEDVLFWLQSLINPLFLLRDWLSFFALRLGGILDGGWGSLLHEDFLHLLTIVSNGVVQETLTSSVCNFEVYSKSNQPLKNGEPVAFDGIKHWSLLEIIHMVMLRSIAFE